MATRRPAIRSALLRTTALQAVVATMLTAPAWAQPAPSARPQGGQVAAGAATIGTTANTTTITQSSNRAAVDWRSFDVGRDQAVRFNQPGASSVTLNRVTGPDPSAIAGKISANGQIVITNRSGVTFFQGAEVNAQSVVVSAADISNRNFMAGRMAFDRPARPDARIDNRGTITVQEAGLAALVAPSVGNSGVINARLGQVVLAGAAAHTLDLYGDGLVSIDVTKQVRQAPVGADGKVVTALVTNTGLIRADGGVVQLTAVAADGVVQTLVRSGGTVRADSVGARTGRIEVVGTGGSVVIEGRVAADGRAPGTMGGAVLAAGSVGTVVAGHVSANGAAGGGTVAVGTTLARAHGTGPAPAGTSGRTVVEAGARISADATRSGDGGRVTVLSTQSTAMGGVVTARGGKAGGNGGTVELSGEQGFRLTGKADVSAQRGAAGTIVLDPRDLVITDTPNGSVNLAPVNGVDPNIAANAGGTATDAYVTPAQIQALTGNVHLEATRDLTVASAVNYTGGGLALDAGRNLAINAALAAPGGVLTVQAGSSIIPGFDPTGALTVAGALSGTGITLGAGTGGIALNASVTTTGSLQVGTTGPLTQTAGSIQTSNLYGVASSVSLPQAGNLISGVGSLASFFTTQAGVTIVTGSALTVGSNSPGVSTGIGVPTGQTISIQADTLNLVSGAGLTSLSAPAGTVIVQPLTAARSITLTSSAVKPTEVMALTTAELGTVSAARLQLGGAAVSAGPIVLGQAGETIDLVANGGFGTLSLVSGGGISQGGPLKTGTLTGSANSIVLTNAGNVIPIVSSLGSSGGLSVTTSGDLSVAGPVSAAFGLQLSSGGTLTVSAIGQVASPGLGLSGTTGVVVGGPVSAAGGSLSLTGGAAGVALSANVTADSIRFNTTGPVTQGGGGITANNMDGTAGSVSLLSATNAIGGVATIFSTFTVTGAAGDFALATTVPLTVGGPSVSGGIAVANARTITLATDGLSIKSNTFFGAPSIALSAPNGGIVIVPQTATTPILLSTGAKPANTLSLTTTELSITRATQLTLGGTNPSTGVRTAGTITFGTGVGGNINLGAPGYQVLNLNTSGAVGQTNPLGIATLTANVGSAALTNGGNSIGAIQNIAATTDFALHSSAAGLSVGVINAGGAVRLSSSGQGGMTLTGNITAASLDVNSLAALGPPTSGDAGVTQTGGVIAVGTLTGSAGALTLPDNNMIGQLGSFSTFGGLSLTNGAALSITGAVSSQVGAVTFHAAGITQASDSSIAAPVLTGSSSADTVLNSPLNVVAGVGAFNQSAGSFTLATSSSTLQLGVGTVAAAAGSLTFITDGVVLAVSSVGGISAPAGTVAFAPFTSGRRIELIGTTAADPASLSLSQALLNRVTAGTLQIGIGPGAVPGYAATASPINIGNAGDTVTVTGHAPVLNLVSTLGVTQTAGSVLVVPTLTGMTGAVNLSGDQVSALGSYASTGAFNLADTTPLSVAGPVSSPVSASIQTTAGLTVAGTVTAPSITLGGSTVTQTGGLISASGTLNLQVTGLASQTGGSISAGSLTGSTGSVSLTQAGNTIPVVNSLDSGAVTLTDSVGLTFTGTSFVGNTQLNVLSGNLVFSGELQASGSTLSLNVAGTATTLSTGVVSAGTLAGMAQALNFANGTSISTLGTFNTSGNLVLANSTGLAVTGAVGSGGQVTLSSQGPMQLTGTVTAPAIAVSATTFTPASSNMTSTYQPGTITQSAGSLNATASLMVAAGDTLTQTGGTFGSIGTVALSSVGTMSLGGVVSGAVVTLTATDRTANAGVGQTALAGSIVQPGGTLTAGTLSGSSTSTTALNRSGNAVGVLGSFGSVGGFSLTDGTALTVNGPVKDATSIGLSVAGALVLNGTVQTGALALNASGAVTQPGGGVIAASLSGGAPGVSLTQRANQVSAIGPLASAGDLALTDGVAVTVAGAVSAGNGRTLTIVDDAVTFGGGSLSAPGGTVALREFTPGLGTTLGGGGGVTGTPPVTAGTLVVGSATGGPIVIAGALNLSTVSTLDLESGSTISEMGAGAVRVGTLIGSGASTALGGANLVGTLGSFTTTGGFVFTNGQALTVKGPLTDGVLVSIGTTGATTSGAASVLTIAGVVSAPTVSLASSGAIVETGGTVLAGTLTGAAGGTATFGSAGNAIGTLGSFSSVGGFALTDGVALAVKGPVIDATSAGFFVSGTLTLNGTVQTGALSLNASGAISQPGGSIVAASLSGAGAGIGLTQRANQVSTIGPLASAGDLALTDGVAVTVAGAVSAGSGRTLTIVDDAVTFRGGSLSAPGGTVALREFTPGLGTTLGGGGGVTGTPPVTAGTLVVGSATGGPIVIAGALNLSTVSTLDLESGSTITEMGAGAVRVGTLIGSGASAKLGGGNVVGVLGGFTTTGGFALTNGQALTVGGPVKDGASVSIVATGGLTLGGSVTAPLVSLTASGAIAEAGGSIVAGTLTGSSGGTTSLGNPGNAVATLGAFSSVGGFALTDGTGLVVTGPVADATSVAFSAGGALSLNGVVRTGGLSLVATGAIAEGSGGVVTAGTLTGSGVSASLNNPNAVGTLGAFATTGGFALANAQALTVTGPLSDGVSVAIGAAGPITLSGAVTAPVVLLASSGRGAAILQTGGAVSASGSVSLTSSGGIGQSGGTIATTVLTGSSGSATVLGSAGNAVGFLGSFGSSGGFTLVDGTALSVTGPIGDATSVTINTAGALTLTGPVTTGVLSLVAGGGIGQSGGSIIASTLTGSGAGVALSQAGNQVSVVGNLVSGGDLVLTDGVALTISGVVSAGAGRMLTLVNDAPSFAAGGSLSAPAGTVALREFTPGRGITLGGGAGLSGNAPMSASRLVVGAASGGPIAITAALNLAGVGTLDLESGGAIVEQGAGTILVGTLVGTGAGVALRGSNQVGTLGAFSTGGDFALTNAQTLAVAGPVIASTISLVAAGDMVLSGTIVASGSISLAATGAITQPGGSLTTNSLTGSAVSALLTQAGNLVGTLAGFRTTGDFALTDGRGLTVTAPVDPNTVTLTITGDLGLLSSVTGGTVVLNVTGGISEGAGGQVNATVLSGSATGVRMQNGNLVGTLGDFNAPGGFTLADNQPLTIGGTLTGGPSVSIGTAGPLTLSGRVTAGSVNVNAGPGANGASGITQTGGVVTASSSASLVSSGAITQAGGVLAVGGFGPGGGLTFVANGPITLGGTIQAGSLSITGLGSVVQTGGAISAGTVTGGAGSVFSLGQAGTASIGAAGPLSAGTSLTLVDAAPLQLNAAVSSPNLAITATRLLVINDGATIATNGLAVGLQTGTVPALPGSFLQVNAGSDGSAGIRQVGTSSVVGYGGGMATLRLGLPASGGAIVLNRLNAPGVDLVLVLGDGNASGSITAGNLSMVGSGGGAALTGSVRSITTFTAAEIARISPAVNPAYTLNGCTIQAAGCSADALSINTIASLLIASIVRPDILALDVLDLSVTRDRDDPTILLPNISNRDY